MTKTRLNSPQNSLPEYQMFPSGMWHMLSAVFLMIICLSILVMLISSLLASWFSEHTLMYAELIAMVLLMLILATATFLVSRGWAVFHVFLVWFNRACIALIILGGLLAFLSGANGMGVTALMGLALGILAHQLYCSAKYRNGVEYYHQIWTHHRASKFNSK